MNDCYTTASSAAIANEATGALLILIAGIVVLITVALWMGVTLENLFSFILFVGIGIGGLLLLVG